MNKWSELLASGQIEGITYDFPDFCAMKGRYHLHVVVNLIPMHGNVVEHEGFLGCEVEAQTAAGY
jgi:hypothetical protein